MQRPSRRWVVTGARVLGCAFLAALIAAAAGTPAAVPPTTSTSTTTSTTLPPWPPPCGETDLSGRITAIDALYVLKAAVGIVQCLDCLCDADASATITTTDALRVLRYAVGLPVEMNCPSCAPAACGDGFINRAGEQCDDRSDARCPGLCLPDCTCGQPTCGDGVVNQPSEQCDGADDDLCATLCRSDCTCPTPSCGNDIREQGEVCDGADLGTQTCASLGFGGGTLSCLLACQGYDTTSCDLPTQLPPDPATVAPSLAPTVVTDVASATEFLYTGSNPVQYGVVAGTIEKRRAALLRGRVTEPDGSPLAGVEIRVLEHGEFGATQTRSDGWFDLVVNGGDLITLVYRKTGYAKVQRKIEVPWQHYLVAPEVVMTARDTKVTTIDLSAPAAVQVARATPVSDARGSRQATLMIPQGTGAELVLPDRTKQPLSTLHLRQTEFTVGDSGPAAMPGELPFGIGYTYAVEFSVDEAEAAGAESVQFDQPIYSYTENFLGFPVGAPVPFYSYDYERAAWVHEPDGIVIEIVGVSGGLADVDIDGDGVAEGQTTLDGIGMTQAERQQLATEYAVGQSLWRVPVTHFSPMDENWKVSLPDDAEWPDAGDPAPGDDPNPGPDGCTGGGSIIECQSQVLGEELAVVGTPFRLVYRSSLTRGYGARYRLLEIPLTRANPPASLIDVRVAIEVAGRSEVRIFSPGPNLSYTFVWDGNDVYGRPVNGAVPVRVSVGYTYPQNYTAPDGGTQLYPAAPQATVWNTWEGTLGGLDATAATLGGWVLDVQRLYDPERREIYVPGKGWRRASLLGNVITAFAGTGVPAPGNYPTGDGSPATDVDIYRPTVIKTTADGSVYFLERTAFRRVGPDGIISTPAGVGFAVDVAFAPNGDRYLTSYEGALWRRYLTRWGYRQERVAGGGTTPGVPDGIPATEADLHGSTAVALAPDGSIYVNDPAFRLVRRVDPSGLIYTVAGGGSQSGEGLLGTQVRLNGPSELAFAADRLYIADGTCVRVLRSDGRLWTLAGDCQNGRSDQGITTDSIPATDALFGYIEGLAPTRDGGLYFIDSFAYAIYRVAPTGDLEWVAGAGVSNVSDGDSGPPKQAHLYWPRRLAVGGDGSLYVTEFFAHRVRRIGTALAGFGEDEILVASEDGRRVDVFDADGRHLRTVDVLTGKTLYQFSYDADGLLATVTDADGNQTVIERDGSGRPTAIVAPGGQRTVLTADANGYIASVTDPGGGRTALTYTAEGLLTAIADPEGNAASFTYDSAGRLLRDDDAAGGFQTLDRTWLGGGFEVVRTLSSGAATTYRVESLYDGVQLTNVFPDATQSRIVDHNDGSRTVTLRDGTTVDLLYGPDPRFGMQSPVLSSLVIRTPAGVTFQGGIERSTTLADRYDPLSLVDLVETVTVNGQSHELRYDAAGRTWTLTSAAGRQTSITTDGAGRIIQLSPAGLASTGFTYDGLGRLVAIERGTAPDLRGVTANYDSAGWLATVIDPLGRSDGFARDPNGRIESWTLPDGRTVQYGYDLRGLPTAVTLPSGATYQFGYTPLGQIASMDLPSINSATARTTYGYDGDRRLVSVGRPDGTSVDLSYDSGAHLAGISHPSLTWSYGYDAATGQLVSLTAPEVTTTLSHDGILLTGQSWSGAVAGNVEIAYDSNLQPSSETLNGSDTLSNAYDADGVITGAGSLTISRDAQSGLPTGTTLGGLSDVISVNSFGEVSDYEASFGGGTLYSVSYTRDALGRITSKTETVEGTTDVYDYVYDTAGRLVETRKNSATVETAAYDADGNRTSHGVGASVETATFDARDRLLTRGTMTYSYAASGELESVTDSGSGDTTTYTYDALGNLTAVGLPDGTAIGYVVDAAGRRVGKKVNGTLVQGFLYKDRLRPVAELDGSGNIVSRFVYAGTAHVPAYMVKGGVEYRIISDHLGSVRLVVDTTTGQVVQRIDYDSWGAVTLDTNPGFQPFGFAGGLYDSDTGLVRFGYRDYDPQAGRWTAPDPLLFAGSDINLYAYGSNDPINEIDPLGLGCPPDYWDRFLRNLKDTNHALFGTPLGFLARGGLGLGLGAGEAVAGVVVFEGTGAAAAALAVPALIVSASLEVGIVIGSLISAAF